MSRSVSFAPGSEWVKYLSFEATDPEDWPEFISTLRCAIRGYPKTTGYKSLLACDKWLGREDHAILENMHGYIGVSEYCGIVSVWCVPKQLDGYGSGDQAMHCHWCAQIEKGIERVLRSTFPSAYLISVGRASNGEQFFCLDGKPGSCVTSKEGRLW